MSKEAPLMPKFDYHLDESDPDVLVLRRQDGTFVAAFSAQGASRDGIVEAAKQDYEALVRGNPGSPASAAGEHPSVRATGRPIHRTS